MDELLVQFDANDEPWWVLQDAGGDNIALADLGGAAKTAQVVAQWTYDAASPARARAVNRPPDATTAPITG